MMGFAVITKRNVIRPLFVFLVTIYFAPAMSQDLNQGFFKYGNCQSAKDSADMHIQNRSMKFYVRDEGTMNKLEKQVMDSLAQVYGIELITMHGWSTDCYNTVIRNHLTKVNDLQQDFWVYFCLQLDSLWKIKGID